MLAPGIRRDGWEVWCCEKRSTDLEVGMSWDQHSNFGYSTVASAPSPATTATSLTVADASVFPAAPFNCTVWPAGVNPLSSNAEIVRVTVVAGNVFTIVRAQEGTTAQSIADGWQIANTTSVKVFTDIENSIILSVSAGGNSAGAPAISFGDANGVSFGLAGNTLTASVVTAAGGGVAVSAGANSQSTGTVVFSNSNNVSFGMDGAGVVTASASNAQSTQPVAASASNGSFLFSTLGFSNGNGVTFGTSAGSIISASVAAGAAAGSISAGANSVALGQVVFSNSNNVSFGLNGSTVTASASGFTQSTQPVAASASNGSFLFSTLGFSNANNVTFGTSAGSIITASINPGAQSTQPVAASASNGSFLFSTLGFSNGNGVTFGTSAGSIISASVAGITSQSNQAASASNGSFAFQTLAFSNANNVTFGTSAGSIITASVATAAGGAAGTLTQWEPNQLGANTNFVAYGSSGGIVFDPLMLPCNLSFNSIRLIISASNSFAPASTNTSASTSGGYTFNFGFFSRSNTNSTHADFNTLLAATSGSYTLQIWTSGSSSSKGATYFWQTDSTGGSSSLTVSTNSSQMAVNGFSNRMLIAIPFSVSLSAGQWFFGIQTQAATAAGAISNNLLISNYEMSWQANSTNKSGFGDTGNGNLNANNSPLIGLGIYSVSGTAFSTSLALPDDIKNPASPQNRRYYVFK